MKNLKLVVIDNAYASWDFPFVREMFNKIILLKKHGFQSRFSSCYTPIDKSDFHGTHFCLCQEISGELVPVTAFKAIEKKRCERYSMPFSGLTLCDSTKSFKHIESIKQFVDNQEGNNIAYLSSFAINPQLEKEERAEAIEFLIPLFAFSHIHWGIKSSLAVGSCRTHTDKMYHQLGLRPLCFEGEKLPSIEIPVLANEEFEIQGLLELSSLCIQKAKECLPLWNSRIHISDASMGHDTVEDYLIGAGTLPKMSA